MASMTNPWVPEGNIRPSEIGTALVVMTRSSNRAFMTSTLCQANPVSVRCRKGDTVRHKWSRQNDGTAPPDLGLN